MDSEYKTLSLADLSGNQPVSSPDMNFNFASDYEASLSKGRDGLAVPFFLGEGRLSHS